jgi:hypothetical protein
VTSSARSRHRLRGGLSSRGNPRKRIFWRGSGQPGASTRVILHRLLTLGLGGISKSPCWILTLSGNRGTYSAHSFGQCGMDCGLNPKHSILLLMMGCDKTSAVNRTLYGQIPGLQMQLKNDGEMRWSLTIFRLLRKWFVKRLKHAGILSVHSMDTIAGMSFRTRTTWRGVNDEKLGQAFS